MNPSGQNNTESVGPDKSSALDRALGILDLLATENGISASAVASALGLSRSTTYRLIDRLRMRGYVDDTGSEGLWRLGPAAARMALAAVQSSDVAQVAPEFLKILVMQTRESVGLGIPRNEDMVFIYRDRGPQSVTVNAEVGARRPMYCTSVGKAFLAALPASQRREVMSRIRFRSFTPNTIMTHAALEEEIERTIERGWSEDRMELDSSSTCCGAPVFNHRGEPVAAISVAGVTQRIAPTLAKIGPIVSSTAEAISRSLGYDPTLHYTFDGPRLDYRPPSP
jgi:DNA-binding IclR family transcriptional regulator